MKNSHSIIFHPKAEREYLESVEWYENVLIGLGQDFVAEIDKILHDNRLILFELMGTHKQLTFPRIELSRKGFDFKYITGIYQNNKGKFYKHKSISFIQAEFSGSRRRSPYVRP